MHEERPGAGPAAKARGTLVFILGTARAVDGAENDPNAGGFL